MATLFLARLNTWCRRKARRARGLFRDPALAPHLEGQGAQTRDAVAHHANRVCEQVVHQGNRAADEFARLGAAVAAVDRAVQGLGGRPTEHDPAVRRWVAEAIRNAVLRASRDAFFEAELNGTTVLLPRDTVRTMTHCIGPRRDGPLELLVEYGHCAWMADRLRPGDVFLDVGAATGATTLPLGRRPGVRVVAFEPARAARRLLEATLAANGYANVEVAAAAVSDAVGTATFAEYGQDETNQTPYLPEASALMSGLIDTAKATAYEVPVTTLDGFFAGRADADRVRVVKVDVEGFEAAVLDGGRGLLARARPYLAIDIHRDPFGDGTADTEAACRSRLAAHGYAFEKLNHVLLCTPAGAGR